MVSLSLLRADIGIISMGALLTLAGVGTIIKIWRGSKVPFAFTMTLFTCLFGIVFILLAENEFIYINKSYA